MDLDIALMVGRGHGKAPEQPLVIPGTDTLLHANVYSVSTGALFDLSLKGVAPSQSMPGGLGRCMVGMNSSGPLACQQNREQKLAAVRVVK